MALGTYIYKADIYCESCGEDIANELRRHKVRDTGDSDNFPQGPYSGAGEADTPQHCGQCGVFLCNPLTSEGVEYVKEAIINHRLSGMGDLKTLDQWQQHYRIFPLDPDTGDEIEL